tara:strand:- start:1103 stop:2248 length:1146 start_codon:yes stop_codon:yes gene_type:complete
VVTLRLKVLKIHFDTAPKKSLHWFKNPSKIIKACSPSEVRVALKELQKCLDNGYWIAGLASYELSYALEAKLSNLSHSSQPIPLIQFGVFDGPSNTKLESSTYSISSFVSEWDETKYKQVFDQVLAYIKAGDIYQANLTFSLFADFQGDPWTFYKDLQKTQKVKYGAYVDLDSKTSILSRSPELFFKTDNAMNISTRPMKGTQPRDRDDEKDKKNLEFLKNDTKNRAENLMIVDLLRNDISRISKVGTVKVPELYKIETYETVHQMTSLIVGEMNKKTTVSELLEALFPCGSITGAPKIRAMEIIHELEQRPRDIYCGTIGWMAPDGSSEFNVAIRTLLIQNGKAVLNVGGGVVFDSTSQSEYEEALWKSRFTQISKKTLS